MSNFGCAYPFSKTLLKIIFLFQRWDNLDNSLKGIWLEPYGPHVLLIQITHEGYIRWWISPVGRLKKNANFLVVCSCSFGEDSEDSGSVVSTWQSFQTTYIHINAHIFIDSFIDTYDLLVPCTLPSTTVVSELESLLKYDQNLLTFPKRLLNSIKLRTRGSCVHVFLHPSEVKMFFCFCFVTFV